MALGIVSGFEKQATERSGIDPGTGDGWTAPSGGDSGIENTRWDASGGDF